MKVQKIIAVSLLLGTIGCSTTQPSSSQSIPEQKQMTEEELAAWYSEHIDDVQEALDVDLDSVYDNLTQKMLSDEKNSVLSPLNLAISLGMLAEVTESESRQQILSLLNMESVEEVREAMQKVWNAGNVENSIYTEKLGASLWVEEDAQLHTDVIDLLNEAYHAEVFSGNLQSDEMIAKLQKWTNEMTGNLLEDEVSELHFPEMTVMEMITTILYKAGWKDSLTELKEDVFHSVAGDQNVSYLGSDREYSYFSGDGYQMVSLPLSYSGDMLIILPDEDLSNVLSIPVSTYMNAEMTSAEVNLKLPEFDVRGQTDMKDILKELGVTDVFSVETADFSPLSDEEIVLSNMKHTARVSIDKDGVQGAAYTELSFEATSIADPEIVEMIVDRPFMFLVRGADGSLVFAGTVVNME